jgi:PAS domain S-box-containing protein
MGRCRGLGEPLRVAAVRPASSAGPQAGARYRDLIESIPGVVYEAEPGRDGAWSYVSPQIEGLLGYSAEQWIAQPQLWASRIHPQDRDIVVRIESRDSEHGWVGEASITEYRMLHREGREIWVRDEARLVRTRDGRIVWRGTLSDITDIRASENSLVDAYERQITGLVEAIRDHVELIDHRLERGVRAVRDFPRGRGHSPGAAD